MNKRGSKLMRYYIIDIIIIAIVLAASVYFIYDNANGGAMQKQLASKRIALLLDAAKPGTIITIDFIGISLDKENKILSVKTSDKEPAYEYEIYNPNKITIKEEDKKTIIEVSEK